MGLRGSITYRHYRAPGERSNWSKEAIRAALVVTDRRLGVFARSRPIVNVAFDDARFTYLDLRVEHASLAIEVVSRDEPVQYLCGEFVAASPRE